MMLGTDQASNKSHEICDSACFDGALKADFGEAVSNSIQGSPTKMPSVTDHTLTSTENISNVNGREMGGTALSPKTDIMTCKVFEGIQANFGPSRTTSEVLDDTNLLMDISRIRQGGVEMGEKNHGEPVCITEALSKSALTAAPSKLLAAPTTGEKSSVLMVRNPAADTFLGHPRDIDIIFGRGEPTRKHPGNVILRGHVNKWLDEYMKGSKMNKSSIIRRVIQDIDESGARYLVPLDPSCRHTIFTAGCREARKSEVRSKVSHAFRDGERRIMLQREKEEKHVDTTGTFTRDRMGIPSETYLSQTTPSGKVTNLQRASSTHAAIENIDKADNSDSIHSPLPKLINAEKPKVEMHHQIDGQEDVSIPLPTPLYSNDTSIPSSEPITPSTDLLSFANILTSLRSNSSPEAPIVDPHDRLQALTTFAASSLSAISHKEKNPKKVKTSRKENLRYASPIVQSLEKYCRKSDIVFGRGAPLRQHPGNIKFRKIVSKYNKRYGEASKHEKTTIIQNVIRELQNTGAKFLIMDESSGVTEASSDDIRMKVSHRFRDFTKEKSSHGRPTTQNNANKSTEEVTTSTNHGAESLMIQV